MLTLRIKLLVTLASALLVFGGVACLDLKNEPVAVVVPAKVSSASLSNNTLIIRGSGLDSVQSLKVNNGGNSSGLKILTKTPTMIQASALSPLTLVAGLAYNLFISTAKGDVTVPITIQINDATLNPSVLSSGGASPGQVLKWNGTAWAPAADNTGASGGAGASMWVVKTDGTPVGPLVTMSGTGFFLWDEADGAVVIYGGGNNQAPYKISGPGSLELFYATADCSDIPHSSATGAASAGSFPNTAYVLGGKMFKTESIVDTITVVSYKTDIAGALSACTPYYSSYTGPLFRMTLVPSPGVPLSLPFGSFKFVRQ